MTIGIDPNGPTNGITVVGNVTLRFRSDRRWIDVKQFTFVDDTSEVDLLARLTAHRQFKDGYIGSGPGDAAIHGPYRLEAVTPDRYEPLDAATAIEWLDGFCALFDVFPPRCLAEDIDSVVRGRMRQAATLFRLRVPDDAQHECGWILDEFRELVVIRRERRELLLVVMGLD